MFCGKELPVVSFQGLCQPTTSLLSRSRCQFVWLSFRPHSHLICPLFLVDVMKSVSSSMKVSKTSKGSIEITGRFRETRDFIRSVMITRSLEALITQRKRNWNWLSSIKISSSCQSSEPPLTKKDARDDFTCNSLCRHARMLLKRNVNTRHSSSHDDNDGDDQRMYCKTLQRMGVVSWSACSHADHHHHESSLSLLSFCRGCLFFFLSWKETKHVQENGGAHPEYYSRADYSLYRH